MQVQGLKRKLVYVTCYELIGLSMSTLGLAYLSETQASHTGPLAVMITTIAMLWNLIFNTLFERWESRQARRGRGLARRVAHAIGFEGGLALILVPLLAWWFGVGLWQALVMDLGLMLFFLGYTFVFNWGFDRVFGLPAAAR